MTGYNYYIPDLLVQNSLTWKASEVNRKPSTRRWYETCPISFFTSARYDELLSIWMPAGPKGAEFIQAKQASTFNTDRNCAGRIRSWSGRFAWKNYLRDIVRERVGWNTLMLWIAYSPLCSLTPRKSTIEQRKKRAPMIRAEVMKASCWWHIHTYLLYLPGCRFIRYTIR